jgi:recombinational DNA repair protein RecT
MPQVGKHQRLKGDTMAILMLNYASIKAVTMSRKQKFKITHEIYAIWIECSNLTNGEWSECHKWDAFYRNTLIKAIISKLFWKRLSLLDAIYRVSNVLIMAKPVAISKSKEEMRGKDYLKVIIK